MALIKKIKKWSKKFLIGAGWYLIINLASIPVTYIINKNIDTGKKTVVFTSGHDKHSISPSVISGIIDFFMYSPITLKQNLKGNSVDWYSNASKETVLENLADLEYENIVFIGHGNNSTYCATDGNITVEDLKELDLPKRDGEFIQHTCGGGDDSESLRDILYNPGSRGYSFDRKINPLENYLTSLIKLFEK